MPENNRINHAFHNEAVCNYLDKRPEFADWVITTAFYSALHFTQYKLFPIKLIHETGKYTFVNLESYYQYNRSFKRQYSFSKHKLLAELIKEHLPQIAPDYIYLKDISWTARYVNYKYSSDISNKAKECLKKIKEYCTL